MEWTLHSFKVCIGVLLWILSCCLNGSSGYYADSGENFGNPYPLFESRKTNLLKRQVAVEYLQHLDAGFEYQDQTTLPNLNLLPPGTEEPANYDFEYKVHGGGNFLGHSESRRDKTTKGSYHAIMPDGRMQVVSYYADETGYHPKITYELVGDQRDYDLRGGNGLNGIVGENRLKKRYTRIVKRVRKRQRN